MDAMYFWAPKIHNNFNFESKILENSLFPYFLSSYMRKMSTNPYSSPSTPKLLKLLATGASTLNNEVIHRPLFSLNVLQGLRDDATYIPRLT